ncbi:uncharacterized protein LOC127105999 [Lathyrus oleraceus]|uniref:uncharacterized protein LOC127105999 n=1 Tax=Pisum sativum TaxID=3888 RepID=UPI0021CEA23E|nr:uncharacterized protein LOC127105999 [Pisum sativum]
MNPERRSIFQFKYKKVDLVSLQMLSVKVTPLKLTDFMKDYGRILSILNEKMGMMTDLAPTLEEFERIVGRNPFPRFDKGIHPKRIASALGLDVSEVVANWDVKGIFSGFSREFLEDQVMKMKKTGNWKAFYDVLVVLVYGIVLFPNIDHSVDHLAVRIFLFGNHVPFLLADLHYALHERHEKKGGTLLFCAQLLHAWFRSHMPEEGPFVSKDLKPSQKLDSLTSGHVKWYIREWETKDIIVSIGFIWRKSLNNVSRRKVIKEKIGGYPSNE